jgi:hypothetical protein
LDKAGSEKPVNQPGLEISWQRGALHSPSDRTNETKGDVMTAEKSTALSRYDDACHALADAKDLTEVKDLADKMAALKAYARRAKNRELEINAAELRIRAERPHGGADRSRRPSELPSAEPISKRVKAAA